MNEVQGIIDFPGNDRKNRLLVQELRRRRIKRSVREAKKLYDYANGDHTILDFDEEGAAIWIAGEEERYAKYRDVALYDKRMCFVDAGSAFYVLLDKGYSVQNAMNYILGDVYRQGYRNGVDCCYKYRDRIENKLSKKGATI